MSNKNDTWDLSGFEPKKLLSEHYDIDGIDHHGDFYIKEEDRYAMEVLVYLHDNEYHYLVEDIPMHGHGPSGAIGFWEDDLPDKDVIESKVNEIRGVKDE